MLGQNPHPHLNEEQISYVNNRPSLPAHSMMRIAEQQENHSLEFFRNDLTKRVPPEKV